MFVGASAIVAILTGEPEADVLADLLNAGNQIHGFGHEADKVH